MRIIIIISFFLFFSIQNFSQGVQQQWIGTYGYNGSAGDHIRTDISGNVYIVGGYSCMDCPYYTFIQKFNPSGSQIYGNTVDTPCAATNVYFDSLNNEYIAGSYSGFWGASRFTVTKYSSIGVKLWRVSDSCGQNDAMIDIVGDLGGTSYVLKYKSGVYTIIKYSSSGIQLSYFNIMDTITPARMCLDTQGNILVTGNGFLNPNNSFNIITIKYSNSGIKQWRSIYTPPGGQVSGVYPKIQALTTGNIYLIATTANSSNSTDYTVIKYNSSGVQQWITFYNRNQYDEIYSFKSDNLENVYVTGSSGTVKFNSSGSQLWADTNSSMRDIAIDKNYNVYVTGSIYDSNTHVRTYKINASGSPAWTIRYGSGSIYSDYVSSITLDTAQNVFITGLGGFTPLPGYNGHAITIKYAQLVGIQKISENIPTHFSLSQNYPNPFNPTTNIKFDVTSNVKSETSNVKLIIFDILGREVSTLVNDKLQPGSYEIEWNGSNFASGVYFYKLTAGDFTETKKMLLVK